jgi:CheY-like chemotaxis protein
MDFEVIDTGIGMTAEEVAELFQPFRRTNTSRQHGFGGTGLGLAISQRLAEKLGGSIAAQSEPGAGSRFTLTLPTGPLSEVPSVHTSAEPMGAAAGSSSTPINPTKLACRILLAEDNCDNQRVISQLLSISGAEVTPAANGQVAIDLALAARAEGRPFDVILMDMQMSILDGYEATRQLRAECIATPIIALTAHAMTDDRAECLRIGCDDFVSKPIDWDNLLARIVSFVNPA